MTTSLENDPRWASVNARDGKADGTFWFGVRTTGIFCRPSCSARHPRPENVVFFGSIQEAQNQGFRACSRCKPHQPSLREQHAGMVAEACRMLGSAEAELPLEQLASSAGMSVSHFHRVFHSVMGMTPKHYAAVVRAERIKGKLQSSSTITEAIYDAGYNSNGRFYEESNRILGMTAKAYRKGGSRTSIRFAVAECSLGSILVAQSDRGICAILLGDDPEALTRDLQDRFPQADLVGADPEFEQLVSTVVGFVERPAIGLDLPLDLRGTAFSTTSLAGPARNSGRHNGELFRDCEPAWLTASSARCGAGLWCKFFGCGDSLSPRSTNRRESFRLSMGHRAKAGTAGAGSATGGVALSCCLDDFVQTFLLIWRPFMLSPSGCRPMDVCKLNSYSLFNYFKF